MTNYSDVAQSILDDSNRLVKIASQRGGYIPRQGGSEETWLDAKDRIQGEFETSLPDMIDEATALAVAASVASGGPLAFFSSYDNDDDLPKMTAALAGLADGIYEILRDETHGGAATRYTVASNVATFQTTLEAFESGYNVSAVTEYSDVPLLIGRGAKGGNVQAQKLTNRFKYLESPGGGAKIGLTDAGNYYTDNTVEGALQEVGGDLSILTTDAVNARAYPSLQEALTDWLNYPGRDFIAPGIWTLSSPITVKSPKAGSKCVIGEIVRADDWPTYSASDSLLTRAALVVLDIGSDASLTWGSSFYVGKIDGKSAATTWNDFNAFGIRNLGWQQSEIGYGYATGLIAAIQPLNTKTTTPTVHYSTTMTRGNLWGVLGNQTSAASSANMAEGSVYDYKWASRNWFGFGTLGWGSAYTSWHGGSQDFNGDHAVAFKVADSATAQKAVLGAIVTQGSATGVCIGAYYRDNDRSYYILVGDSVRTDGSPSATNFDGTTAISIAGVVGAITIAGIRTPQADETGTYDDDQWWYPGIQCIAPSDYPITRWRVIGDFGGGTTFATPAQSADSIVSEVTQVRKRQLSVGGAGIFPEITNGAVVFGSSRYVTQYKMPNAFFKANGVFTERKTINWKHNGSGTTTEYATGASSVQVFSGAELGYGQVTGRIQSASGDPGTDVIGMWRISAFGRKADGTSIVAEWAVTKTTSSDFQVSVLINNTNMTIAGDSAGVNMTGNIGTAEATAGALWPFRAFVVRVGVQ